MGIQLDQGGVRGKFPLVNYYMGDTLGEFLRAAQFIDVTLPPYSCDPSGSRDSTTGLQQAILDCGTTGGIVYLPGTFLISQTLPIGNGASGVASTRNGVILLGGAPPQTTYPTGGSTFTSQTFGRLLWSGTGTGSMVQVQGPLQGWGVQNLQFDGANVATTGLQVISAQKGDCRNLDFVNVQLGLQLTAWSVAPAGWNDVECMHNRFVNLLFVLQNASGAYGLQLTGNSTFNSAYNKFENATFVFPISGTATVVGCYLGGCDSNVLEDLHLFGGTATMTALVFDYTNANAAFPSANTFYAIDYKASATITQVANVGAPSGATANAIFGLMQANGATDLSLANLVVFANSGAITGQGVFTAWTPTYSASSGTLGTTTTNAARYTQLGKTVQFFLDVSITSAGTTPSGFFQFTLPVVPRAVLNAGAISGWEQTGNTAFNGYVLGHGLGDVGRVARYDGNSSAAVANGNRIVVSGMYEAA